MTKSIHQPHDKLFKHAMSEPCVAKEFFETHLPQHFLKRIDLTTLTLQKTSFLDEAYKTSEADVVYSVKLGESTAYLYLLCELQSDVDRMMAFRLLGYKVRIMEMHMKQYPKDSLPIVYPLVLYCGNKTWNAALDVYDLFAKHEDLARQMMLESYHLIDISRISDDELQRHVWSGLLEFVLKYRKVRDLAKYLESLLPWLRKIEMVYKNVNYGKIILKYVVNGIDAKEENIFIQKSEQYLTNELRSEAMTLAQLFEKKGYERGQQEAKTLAQAFEQKGYERGQQEARNEKYEIARKLLNKNLPLLFISELTGISVQLLQEMESETV